MEKNKELFYKIESTILKDSKRFEDYSKFELFKEIFSFIAEVIPFNEPDPNDMLDVYEDEKIGCDLMILSDYARSVGNHTQPYSRLAFQEHFEDVVKVNYDGHQIDTAFIFELASSDIFKLKYVADFQFKTKISTSKRFNISIGENLKIDNNEELLDEYDEKFESEIKGYLSNLCDYWGQGIIPSVKYNPSNSMLDFINDLINLYKLPFLIDIKDSCMVINVKAYFSNTMEDESIALGNVIDIVTKIVDEFSRV